MLLDIDNAEILHMLVDHNSLRDQVCLLPSLFFTFVGLLFHNFLRYQVCLIVAFVF